LAARARALSLSRVDVDERVNTALLTEVTDVFMEIGQRLFSLACLVRSTLYAGSSLLILWDIFLAR